MVYIIIPAYNEESAIGRVIRDLFNHGWQHVVVVDDGSIDNTARIGEESGAVVLRHVVNRGQGASLETGDSYARLVGAEYVVHFDGDGQFNPADIAPALGYMKKENLDVLLGSRFLDNRSRMPALKRYFILPISRWVNFVFTGLLLTDAHNGFRILSRSALSKIIITQDRMAHNTEIAVAIKKHGLLFREFPIEVVYHRFGQGVSGGLKIISDLVFKKISH